MEDSSTNEFDTFYFGTTVTDTIKAASLDSNSLVIDEQYGTTFTELRENKYIKNIKVYKDMNEKNIKFELSMGLIIKNDIFNIFNHKFIKFEPLRHFYYENSREEVPYNVNNLVKNKYMTQKDKRIFMRILEGKNNYEDLSDKFRSFLLNAFLVNERNAHFFTESPENLAQSFFTYYFSNFNDPYFYFPAFGMKDISEFLGRTNSFKGIGYLIDKNISISSSLSTEYGIIKCKNMILPEYKSNYHCRCIYSSLYIEDPYYMVTSKNLRILALNNKFFHCTEGMVFFIWDEKEISNDILEILNLSESQVDLDISFISLVEDEFIYK